MKQPLLGTAFATEELPKCPMPLASSGIPLHNFYHIFPYSPNPRKYSWTVGEELVK